MKQYNIVMQWEYSYDKEGTWFDNDNGVVSCVLQENTHFTLPHCDRKRVEVRKVQIDGDVVTAEVYVDYRTYTITNNCEPVVATASYSYSVCGDCVDLDWVLKFTIE